MLIFSVFCVTIWIVHSDDPFELVCGNSILLQNHRYGHFFIVSTSFYNARLFFCLKKKKHSDEWLSKESTAFDINPSGFVDYHFYHYDDSVMQRRRL